MLDDYSIIVGQTPASKKFREKATRGQTTTFSVYCTPLRPNNAVFSPPVGGSSISLEKLREGIVDFEKIFILRELTRNLMYGLKLTLLPVTHVIFGAWIRLGLK